MKIVSYNVRSKDRLRQKIFETYSVYELMFVNVMDMYVLYLGA